jgi:hypothetical protein
VLQPEPEERRVDVGPLAMEASVAQSFAIPVAGGIRVETRQLEKGVFKVSIDVENRAGVAAPATRDDALLASLISTHLVIIAERGELVSLLDPPPELRAAAEGCRNAGVFPVLSGEQGDHDVMLASPIILYDYPRIAPESAGDLFDGTEIDEILSLRILTLTDDEKREISDSRARQLLDRTEALSPEELAALHGTMRNPFEETPPLDSVCVFGVDLRRGDRVRLWPQKRADIMDTALEGKSAVIEAIELDFEDRIHIAVVVDDDPGADLGALRQIAHRFFFSPEEVEPL